MVPNGRAEPPFAVVEAKIQRPVHREGLIARTRLLEALAATPERISLILVTAPAGYGKTTALSQWATADPREFAWVTVDEADGDPVRLAGHVALALHRIQPLDPAVFRALEAGDRSRHLTALSHLLTSLRTWNRRGVVVLDDVHELRTVGAMNFIRALAAGLPAGFQLTVGSRLTLGFGRLRSEDRIVEFGVESLAFTKEEARAILAHAGADSSDDTVRTLVQRTEGWPAGVYLAARAIRTASDPAVAARRLTGDDPYIVDYFRDEFLVRESPEIVRFLLRTAVLGQMSGALCDHVLGQSGSAGRLAEAARRNLFVVPLDRRGEWYRYHCLVAEMLVSELRRREPAEESQVHRRAADWYEQQGQIEKAIEHRLAGADTGAAAGLINRHAPQFVAAGRLQTVRRWLDALGEDGLVSYPPLAITAAWTLALIGDMPGSQRCLHAAERGSFDGPLPDGSSSLVSAVTVLRASLGALGVDRMLLDARAATEYEPPGSPWFPSAMAALGIAHALSGAADMAVKELGLAARLGAEGRPPTAAVGALAELSLIAADRDDWSDAEDKAGQAVDLIETAGIEEHLFSVLGYVAAARVAAHQGNQVAAQRHAGTVLRMNTTFSPAVIPWLSVQVAIALAETFLELGDFAAARLQAEEAGRQLDGLLTEGALRQQLSRVLARFVTEDEHVPVPSAMALTRAEMRVLQLLPTHLSLGQIGEELFLSRNTVKAHLVSIRRKLQCASRNEVVARCRDLGLLRT
ncbi:LuxR C-terminal-related transcriptional regulator [Actinoplanes sp. CA-142083]|uniref:LuxR C-terminal-related transcriptional regulator n=1 Tax=Actinoplanes sp. CA-142083 TaxID=3239903 RepID=UPI003D936255